MKKRIIQTALALTALVASFLPQQAEAACKSICYDDEGNIERECTANFLCLGCINGIPICIDA